MRCHPERRAPRRPESKDLLFRWVACSDECRRSIPCFFRRSSKDRRKVTKKRQPQRSPAAVAENATTLPKARRREWRTRSSHNLGIHAHRVKASWADGSWCEWGCDRAGLRPGLRIWTRTGTWGRTWDTPQKTNLQNDAGDEIGLKSPHQTDDAQVFNRKLVQFRTRFPN
jgi:hypothetical protein